MNTMIITIAQGTTVDTFLEGAAKGTVKFYTQRANGTERHIPFLALGTVEREYGEWVLDQREQGVTMQAIAKEMHASVPSVRRLINQTLLANEVEEFDNEEIAEWIAIAAEEVVETTEATNDAV